MCWQKDRYLLTILIVFILQVIVVKSTQYQQNQRQYALCLHECFIDFTQEQAVCAENCAQARQTRSKAKVAFAVIGSLIGFGLLVVLFCFLCMCCPLHTYQRFRRKFNEVDPGQMTEEEYIVKRDKIMNTINQTSKKNPIYLQSFYVQDRVYESKTSIVLANQQDKQPYITKVQLIGQDKHGQWMGDGYILSKNGGHMYIWYYKWYQMRRGPMQGCFRRHTMFESQKINFIGPQGTINQIEGQWYIHTYKNSPDTKYSGKWIIQRKVELERQSTLQQLQQVIIIQPNQIRLNVQQQNKALKPQENSKNKSENKIQKIPSVIIDEDF